MGKKQTSIDWLIDKWEDNEFDLCRKDFQQAKEMYKQEIINAFIAGDNSDCTSEENSKEFAEQYYNI